VSCDCLHALLNPYSYPTATRVVLATAMIPNQVLQLHGQQTKMSRANGAAVSLRGIAKCIGPCGTFEPVRGYSRGPPINPKRVMLCRRTKDSVSSDRRNILRRFRIQYLKTNRHEQRQSAPPATETVTKWSALWRCTET
jgi:hypothetical protein